MKPITTSLDLTNKQLLKSEYARKNKSKNNQK